MRLAERHLPDGLTPTSVLGMGGMGAVVAAHQADLDRTIAVKFPRPESDTPAHREALLAEARITGAVSHPNVVPIHDVRTGPRGEPHVLLERVDGQPWSRLLEDPSALVRTHGELRPLDFHISVLAEICAAVHAAHARGIVHRDIKPANVVIAAHGGPVLLDWGLAVTLRADADPRLPRLIPANRTGGTPDYMAPEMVSPRHGEIGPWTDVYLLGGTLYQILFGRPPHQGETAWAMLLSACRDGVDIPDEGPPALIELCRRCLERDPNARIQDAETVRRALITWRERRASMQLAEEGRAQHALLRSLIEGAEPGVTEMRVHELFGAAVFAYHRALEAWPDNREARTGLQGTVETVVDHCVQTGAFAAAHATVGYLDPPAKKLHARIEAAERAEAGRRRRRHRWAAAGREHLNEATSVRPLLLTSGAAMIGVSGVTALVYGLFAPITSTVLLVAAVAGLGSVLAGVAAAAMRPMRGLDKRIAAHLVYYGVARALVIAIAASWGSSGAVAASLDLGVMMILGAMQSLAFRRRFWPISLTAGVSAVCCLVFPEAAAMFLALSYAGLATALLMADLSTRGPARTGDGAASN